MDDINLKSYCPYCYPAKNNHFVSKMGSIVDFYLIDPMDRLLKPLMPKSFSIGKYSKQTILAFSTRINHIKLTEDIDRSQFNNGTLVFWDEAKRRDLTIFNLKFHGRHTEHFCIKLNGKLYYYDSNPIFLLPRKLGYDEASPYDDKETFRKKLLCHQLPTPRGQAFISSKKALAYGLNLGFPLIVKPSFSSLSCHVSLKINSESELIAAIKMAKQVNYKIIVEQYIPGDAYRAIIIKNSLVACNKRIPGSISGNGKDTVDELIERRNNHPERGEPGQKNYTLFKIKITKQLQTFLNEQGVKLKTRLAKGQKVFLSQKMNAGNSGDMINVTDSVHPENTALLEKVHQVLNLSLSGLDFICKDISIPWYEQSFAFIESNSLPGVSQHHYPSSGEPINVAGKVWDFILEVFTTHNVG